VLLKQVGHKRFHVVYVGLSRRSIRGRLRSHRQLGQKGAHWTHFSIFEVSRRVTDADIGELEGLFHVLYRRDPRFRGEGLNVQTRNRGLYGVRRNDLSLWK
jgi:hypothetical protein